MEPAAGRRPVAAGGAAGEGGPPCGPPSAGLRDAGALTVPNALTFLRILLAPAFLWLYASGDVRRALPVFAVAAGTDVLDGLSARLLRQHSRLGEILDPIADKLLAFCALVALAWAGRVPAWLPALVVGRDAAIVSGAFLLQALGVAQRLRVIPTRAGKYATFMLTLLVFGELLCDLEPALLAPLVPWLAAVGLLMAFFVVVSFLQYAGVFARAVRGHLAPTESR